MKTRRNRLKWTLIALFAALITAPNPTIIRWNVIDTDPIFFTFLRYVVVALICIPFVYLARKKLNKKNVTASMLSGIFIGIALTFFSLALEQSQANYVVVLMLLSPVVFIALSSKIVHEKISHRAMTGLTVAMLGAFTVVAAPIAIAQDSGVAFYPIATLFMIVQSVGFAMAMIWMRKANESGASMPSVIGIQSLVAVGLTGVFFLLFGDTSRTEINSGLIWSLLYSGIVVALIARSLNVLSYERIGSVMVSGMSYIDTLVAFIIPLVVLGEKLSPTTVVGGILILVGVYLIEKRKQHVHRGVHHSLRHH